MTQEEIKEFKETIARTIIPIVQNMTEEQIRDIIKIVEKEHKDLPDGFGNMLYEQILIMKYNGRH
ncbi:hypothetical protein [Halarcobacter bivalviorum]|uniref:Uncharacterized protein n=1 Tax=Halarcobacter bivalviorum TaxID=663364 RepID=A0AAX2AAR9_9BACT|nr:hypothetical protein [Halarcobacter bivalviorum]AXH12352.1 hypothetical protein ABIV_1356 [Halarcobacter bivalviorum]RXK07813.1 hypothetical protein CRU97_00270 [Halarcobacter bivalviorum]RXK10717.1 hypothetical protein CRV05_05415 [Halarcobacter bivalviorum]